MKYDIKTFEGISHEKLEKIINDISEIKVGIIGDLCLDVYWKADMTKSELSRETPYFSLPVVEETMAPGAGGNVASNIAALKPAGLFVAGLVGNDWRGKELLREIKQRGIQTDYIVRSKKHITNACCKPLRKGFSEFIHEGPRIDFYNFTTLSEDDELSIMENISFISEKVDILCVADQFKYGIITEKIKDLIVQLARNGLMVIVDSRDRIGFYNDVVLKPNEIEAWRAVYSENPEKAGFHKQVEAARTLAVRNSSKVCMTLGSRGCVYTNGDKVVYVPSFEVKPPIDICGAGDTFLSAFACALATGVEFQEAASFANMASDVTVKKTGMTGTALREEIRERHSEIFQ